MGPGGLPRDSNINGLRLQTFVSARIGTKGVLGAVTNRSLIAPASTVGGAKHHDFARRQIVGESKPQQKSRKSSGPHALPCTLTAATTARAISQIIAQKATQRAKNAPPVRFNGKTALQHGREGSSQ